MDTDLLKALYKLVDTPEQFDAYVNENTRLSFYADFLYPLASQSSLEQYYKEHRKVILHQSFMNAARNFGRYFIHFI